mmetsp:Transcript_8442/g.18070  ORF Transcript_8442/g.18070 Transcript_8442/m.18070 type:complete len:561 (+) Transcript_8442:68-1750(+)|eukprot:CAMPEP_0202893866 /NCGR_PEP_ID=MMETSP1392-20130828/3367_1 /ASSEMBLY_ACC=CAM_ASM_000868 /TAXON_ID=225041 /ORGANISM="Chlamydomonas chlamydogama, Strain SAG 11-48b" /LENGTH=560 /DNA_ID=CAMNT_0049578353 /DNA_START=8 /DNA_END=1690 /DNA_ORIENTATION=-
MKLTVRTLKGNIELEGVPESLSIDDLKTTLYREHGGNSFAVPPPDRQRLIYKDFAALEGTVGESGLANGSTVVLVHVKENPKPTPVSPVPVPTASIIRNAIYEEARRRGVEHTLRDEAPFTPMYGDRAGLPAHLVDIDNRLSVMLATLENRLWNLRQNDESGAGSRGSAARARQPGAPGAAGAAAAAPGAGGSAGQQQQQQQQPVAPAPPPRQEPPREIRAPTPNPEHVAQLCDMGFPDPVVRKALALCRNSMQAALEWLLQHAEDPDAAEPPTQQQLQQVYGSGGQNATFEEQVESLVAMGFERAVAANALRRTRNVDLALTLLLEQQNNPAPAATQQQQQQQQARAGSGNQDLDGISGFLQALQQLQESVAASAGPAQHRRAAAAAGAAGAVVPSTAPAAGPAAAAPAPASDEQDHGAASPSYHSTEEEGMLPLEEDMDYDEEGEDGEEQESEEEEGQHGLGHQHPAAGMLDDAGDFQALLGALSALREQYHDALPPAGLGAVGLGAAYEEPAQLMVDEHGAAAQDLSAWMAMLLPPAGDNRPPNADGQQQQRQQPPR